MFGSGCCRRCQGEAEELQKQALPKFSLAAGRGAPLGAMLQLPSTATLQGEPQADVDPSAEGLALSLHSPILHLSRHPGTLHITATGTHAKSLSWHSLQGPVLAGQAGWQLCTGTLA